LTLLSLGTSRHLALLSLRLPGNLLALLALRAPVDLTALLGTPGDLSTLLALNGGSRPLGSLGRFPLHSGVVPFCPVAGPFGHGRRQERDG
jgi:hypothetical protein